MRHRIAWSAWVLAGHVGLAGGAAAQQIDDEEARNQLNMAGTISCKFTAGVQTDWATGKPATRELPKPELTLEFTHVNPRSGTARMKSEDGSAEVFVFPSRHGFNILDKTPTGAVNLISVFARYVKGTKQLIAVASRHTTLDSPLPSQRHGTCTAGP